MELVDMNSLDLFDLILSVQVGSTLILPNIKL